MTNEASKLLPELGIIRAIMSEDIVVSRAEVERLIAENERLRAENALYSRSPTYDEMAKRIAALEAADEEVVTLRARITELERALEARAALKENP